MTKFKGLKMKNCETKILMFADDIALVSESQNELQKMLKECENYGKKWRLEFSAPKTKIVTNCKDKITCKFNTVTLKKVPDWEYLGLKIGGSGINWDEHFSESVKEFRKAKGQLQRLCGHNKCLAPSVMKNVYRSVVLSKLLYACELVSINQKIKVNSGRKKRNVNVLEWVNTQHEAALKQVVGTTDDTQQSTVWKASPQ